MNQSESTQTDKIIRSAFPPAPALSKDFEAQVMQRARSTQRHWIRGNLVTFSMAIYWTIAVSITAWLLQGAGLEAVSDSADTGAIQALLPAIMFLVLPLIWMSRQIQTRISDLFLKTLQ